MLIQISHLGIKTPRPCTDTVLPKENKCKVVCLFWVFSYSKVIDIHSSGMLSFTWHIYYNCKSITFTGTTGLWCRKLWLVLIFVQPCCKLEMLQQLEYLFNQTFRTIVKNIIKVKNMSFAQWLTMIKIVRLIFFLYFLQTSEAEFNTITCITMVSQWSSPHG